MICTLYMIYYSALQWNYGINFTNRANVSETQLHKFDQYTCLRYVCLHNMMCSI